ncbi:EF-hand domain-containing protein [Luteolibacter pohnpeiensis]|uniref:EF-hand domain-containing protein n=1 Tax=Luteolibacter pohnpeiensis TaxID=454153 RepID=A0A934S3X4_9BACT|nr:EF-hand domain-containing protein [Luteolibacter pohnpeiensis]MBK1882715.1 EF-hand domain-containing protein [Luteolibacter pohnpeiensis]
MKTSTAYLLLTVGFTCLAACAAPSRGNGKRLEAKFAELDTNHDGKLDYAEFSKSRVAANSDDPKSLFNKADTNHDAFLSQEEILIAIKSRKG